MGQNTDSNVQFQLGNNIILKIGLVSLLGKIENMASHHESIYVDSILL